MQRPFLSICAVVGVVACSSGSGGQASTFGEGGTGSPGDDGGSGGNTPGGDGGGAGEAGPPPVTYGPRYPGAQYALGPVDYAETKLHNACAPASKYSQTVQTAEGTLLAALPGGVSLWGGIPSEAGFCDACIWVTTAKGRSALLRVVSYGQGSGSTVAASQDAYQALFDGESPRTMSWQFAECPSTGPMIFEFRSDASPTSTNLWVRNARVPLAKAEVLSANHPSYTALQRESDGSLGDPNGFGVGPFSIRLTGVDGQQIMDSFMWPTSGLAGTLVGGIDNFN